MLTPLAVWLDFVAFVLACPVSGILCFRCTVPGPWMAFDVHPFLPFSSSLYLFCLAIVPSLLPSQSHRTEVHEGKPQFVDPQENRIPTTTLVSCT